MSILLFCKAWAATTIFFLAIDSLWLGLVARSFYRENLGFLMKESINFPVAAGFYVIYSAAIVYLASMLGFRDASAASAVIAGAVLGLAAYGTYDITNLSTLENWPVLLSIVDMAWGTALSALSAYVGHWALTAFA